MSRGPQLRLKEKSGLLQERNDGGWEGGGLGLLKQGGGSKGSEKELDKES